MQSTVAPSKGAMSPTEDIRSGKYLIFQLGREEFGIRVVKVRKQCLRSRQKADQDPVGY